MKSIDKVCYQNMLNKMQRHNRRMMNIQPKILQESSLQCIQTSYLQYFKKVGCILVTSHLQQFLENYLRPSDKQAFIDIYHMLALLDRCLYDNPKQHTHRMSSDNKYVILLKYVCLDIDLSTFLTLWAVLSILLDTQDSECEHVKILQEEYKTYYTDKSRKYMLKLESQ